MVGFSHTIGLMRISQLESLNESELALIVYIVNVLTPIKAPNFKIETPSDLLWINHDDLLLKLIADKDKLTGEGKQVFESVMIKLNRTIEQEIHDHQESINPDLEQLQFNYETEKTSENINLVGNGNGMSS